MDLPDTTFRISGEGGIRLEQVNFSGDDALVTWLKAATGLAQALGIEVFIGPSDEPGRVELAATRLEEPQSLAGLSSQLLGKPVRLVPK